MGSDTPLSNLPFTLWGHLASLAGVGGALNHSPDSEPPWYYCNPKPSRDSLLPQPFISSQHAGLSSTCPPPPTLLPGHRLADTEAWVSSLPVSPSPPGCCPLGPAPFSGAQRKPCPGPGAEVLRDPSTLTICLLFKLLLFLCYPSNTCSLQEH